MSYLALGQEMATPGQQLPQSQMDAAMDQVFAIQRQQLADSMQQVLAGMMAEMQEAGSRIAMTNLGIAIGLKSLPIAQWAGQAIMGIVSGIQGQYAEEAKQILESAKTEAISLQEASERRIDRKLEAAVEREKPFAVEQAMAQLGMIPPSQGLEGFGDWVKRTVSRVTKEIRRWGHDIESEVVRPVAHSIRSYVGGRIVKEKAIEEKKRILSTVRSKLAQHEQQVDELIESPEFRTKLRDTMVTFIVTNPQIRAMVDETKRKIASVKRAESMAKVKKGAMPVALGAGAGLLLMALLK